MCDCLIYFTQWEIGWLKSKKCFFRIFFWPFYSTVNTPTKKKPKYETPCPPPPTFPVPAFKVKILYVENLDCFYPWKGQLWSWITRVLFGFCSAYSETPLYKTPFIKNPLYKTFCRSLHFSIQIDPFIKKLLYINPFIFKVPWKKFFAISPLYKKIFFFMVDLGLLSDFF